MPTDRDKIIAELSNIFQGEISDLRKFIDRRVAEVSSEVSASIQFMEMNEENFNAKILSLKSDLNEVLSSNHSDLSNGGLELDFIAKVTASAANNIMDKLESLETVLEDVSLDVQLKQKIQHIVMGIYSDCEFQDLVGQRVSRIKEKISDFDEVVSSKFGYDEPVVNKGDILVRTREVEINQSDIDLLFE